jgi:serine/threonine-protein phosphatase 2A activator
LISCHTSVIGAVLNLPRIMSCCESQTYSQCFASFGNPTRMDYGTGHETMFVFFLLCLEEIGLVTVEDHRALVCRVFAKYVSVVRTLQTVYWSVLFSIV